MIDNRQVSEIQKELMQDIARLQAAVVELGVLPTFHRWPLMTSSPPSAAPSTRWRSTTLRRSPRCSAVCGAEVAPHLLVFR